MRLALILIFDQVQSNRSHIILTSEQLFSGKAVQCMAEHFIHILNGNYLKIIKNSIRYFLKILLVVYRNKDGFGLSSVCRKQLSLRPPIGRTLPRRVISPVMARS